MINCRVGHASKPDIYLGNENIYFCTYPGPLPTFSINIIHLLQASQTQSEPMWGLRAHSPLPWAWSGAARTPESLGVGVTETYCLLWSHCSAYKRHSVKASWIDSYSKSERNETSGFGSPRPDTWHWLWVSGLSGWGEWHVPRSSRLEPWPMTIHS